MLFYSNIPNRKQALKQRLAIPAGFRLGLSSGTCHEFDHVNESQKLIFFKHQEANLTFAKINLYQNIYSQRQDMFLSLTQSFTDAEGYATAPVRANIKGQEFSGQLVIQTEGSQGGTIALMLTAKEPLCDINLMEILSPAMTNLRQAA